MTTSEIGEASIDELAEALDSYIPEPERAVDGAFSDAGRGRIFDLGVAARWRRAGWSAAMVKVGEEMEIVGIRETTKTTVHGC